MPYAEMHGLEMERVEDYLVEVFEVATDEEEDEEIYDDRFIWRSSLLKNLE